MNLAGDEVRSGPEFLLVLMRRYRSSRNPRPSGFYVIDFVVLYLQHLHQNLTEELVPTKTDELKSRYPHTYYSYLSKYSTPMVSTTRSSSTKNS